MRHFSIVLLWTLNGIAFYVLIFPTGQWLRLVPVTWGVFPAALSTALQYASLNFPVDESWTRYNGLQQLSYFITVFIAAPVSILTGLMQSPALSNRFGLFGTVLNRQAARSIHFISFCWFVLFILAHGIMVFVTGLRQNTNYMFGGVESTSWVGFPLFVLAMVLVGLAWWVASPFTIQHARLVQRPDDSWRRLAGLSDGGSQTRAKRRRKPPIATPNSRSSRRWWRMSLLTIVYASVDWWRNRASFPSPISRPCRSKSKSPRIFASKDGRALPSGAAFRCAISLTS